MMILMNKHKILIKSLKENKSSLIIGEGATIKGEIKEENEITIQGNVDGDIECKDLIIGKTGSVKGKIKTDTLYVEGSIEGEIQCKGTIKTNVIKLHIRERLIMGVYK